MKKTLFTLCALAALVSCQSLKEEWQPVFTLDYGTPDSEQFADAQFANHVITPIKDLKALYKGTKVDILEDIVISGYVVSSDHAGNVYRSLYIQDATGAIEIKTGRTSQYAEYPLGRKLYVKCQDLVLGQYGGALQLGLPSSEDKYDTSYMDLHALVDQHVFKGAEIIDINTLREEISDAQIKNLDYVGRYVTIPNVTYGNKIFVILYDRNNNSQYLRNKDNYGVTTWSISKDGFERYMQTGFNGTIPEANRGDYDASAYTLSQYFKTPGGTEVQVRTSGYAKFADAQIDPAILGGAKVDLTGLLSYYNGNYQFTLLDLTGVQIK